VSDHLKELADAVSGLLASRKPGDLWAELAALGFTSLTVPEELGGSGGDLRDAAVVVAQAARHGVALPVAEAAFLAGPLLAAAGIEMPGGVLTSGLGSLTSANGKIEGTIPNVAFLRGSRHLVSLVSTDDGHAVALVAVTAPGLAVEPGANLAGEDRDTAVLTQVTPERLVRLPPGDWPLRAELLGAAARATQIGGAAGAVLDLAVTHASQRVQFGRPLAKFQAVQELLARLAADTTTVTVAADAAVQALNRSSPDAELLVAAAKAEASGLATPIAAAGHQVHGAIGYTAEHQLGGYTKRLWSWRQEYGNELYWHRRIAGLVRSAEGDLWPVITSGPGR
jgi:acyl-CoA dehydrogenase